MKLTKPTITCPYGSRDTAHVPPPDPANFWDFEPGQERTIGHFSNSIVSFRVDSIHDTRIQGLLTLGAGRVSGELWMDRPVVILRDRFTLEPHVTLTLRRIASGKAYLQVTASPSIPVGVSQ